MIFLVLHTQLIIIMFITMNTIQRHGVDLAKAKCLLGTTRPTAVNLVWALDKVLVPLLLHISSVFVVILDWPRWASRKTWRRQPPQSIATTSNSAGVLDRFSTTVIILIRLVITSETTKLASLGALLVQNSVDNIQINLATIMIMIIIRRAQAC